MLWKAFRRPAAEGFAGKGALRSLNQDGMAVVMVTHDIQNALTEADFVLHMSEGEYFYETTEEYKKRINTGLRKEVEKV